MCSSVHQQQLRAWGLGSAKTHCCLAIAHDSHCNWDQLGASCDCLQLYTVLNEVDNNGDDVVGKVPAGCNVTNPASIEATCTSFFEGNYLLSILWVKVPLPAAPKPRVVAGTTSKRGLLQEVRGEDDRRGGSGPDDSDDSDKDGAAGSSEDDSDADASNTVFGEWRILEQSWSQV